MQRILWTLAVGALLALPLQAKTTARSWSEQFPSATLRRVDLDIQVGEVLVDGWEGSNVQIEIELQCERGSSRCRQAAAEAKLVTSTDNGTLRFRIEEWPHFLGKGLSARVQVQMPRSLALDLDLGVGAVRVTGLENDVGTDLGVGEISISLAESAVASVSADTGVGDARLRAGGRRYQSSGLLSHELHWDEGTGRAQVSADCGVGEIDVTLVP